MSDFGAASGSAGIKHVFVLMLENRAFDHMLGLSGLTGSDAVTGQPTQIVGLTGTSRRASRSHAASRVVRRK